MVIEPDDELRHRVFNVSDEQLHGFVRALVTNGIEDFRVVRQDATRGDPFDAGGEYVLV